MTYPSMGLPVAAYAELAEGLDHLLTALGIAVETHDLQATAQVMDDLDSLPAVMTRINEAAHACFTATPL